VPEPQSDPNVAGLVAADERRVLDEYRRRASDTNLDAYYRRIGRHVAELHAQRRERTLSLLRRLGAPADQRILDVGCGAGLDIAYLAQAGYSPPNLHGLDVIPDAIASARTALPTANFVIGNAADLPYPDGSFDAVLQTTVLSSITDRIVRLRVASEMARVTRAGGLLISYDVRQADGSNRHTVAIDESELHDLYSPHGALHSTRMGPDLRLARIPRRIANVLGSVPALQGFILANVVVR
jgi:SAM-dependent methyltransferase